MRTERLYYGDAYARQFRARVVERRDHKGKAGVILDRTLFYPTSGGQPHDSGLLGGLPVLDVVEEGEAIVHVLPAAPAEENVEGIVDWGRRFDHMQQHTGQHILSQTFIRLLGAETVSFHLGEEVCTIDIATTGLTAEQMVAAEDLANEVVYANQPVTPAFVTPQRLAELPLRKPPTVSENVRIVEVAGFDWSPCGGTHCRATGEVGLVKIRRTERRGGDTRVEFFCGRRALLDYRWKNDHIGVLASALSARDNEAVGTALRGLEEAKACDKEMQALRDALLVHEAARLLANASREGGVSVVAEVFADREVGELKRLALRLVAGEKVVALLATQGRKGHLLFARSADVACDVNAVLRSACALIGGRGGGTPSLAQGGAPEAGRVAEAVAHARRQVKTCLSRGSQEG